MMSTSNDVTTVTVELTVLRDRTTTPDHHPADQALERPALQALGITIQLRHDPAHHLHEHGDIRVGS
jgi:hypothetical protein